MSENALREKQKMPTKVARKRNLRTFQIAFVESKSMFRNIRSDFELINFVHRFERLKKGKRKLRIRIIRAINQFYYSFPYYWQTAIKRYMDIGFAFMAFIVGLPLMGIIAGLIKVVSKGPVIYKQVRVGKDGELFTMYKFRTMRVNAEKESGPIWAKDHDPRVTKLGDFLRRTHLDELPQLINVLRGEMSVVGPRPERPYFVQKLKEVIPSYEERLHVKPGITGLAQVRHRYDQTIDDVKKKVKYDMVYIRKMCLLLDLRVLFWTVGLVFSGKRPH